MIIIIFDYYKSVLSLNFQKKIKDFMDPSKTTDFLLKISNISQVACISQNKELFKTKENLNDVCFET